MPAPPPETARFRFLAWPVVVPAIAAAIYAFGHLGWYRETPLGQVPVMDEHENLALAEAIVCGEVSREPFYRAPGYAVLLASLRVLGVPTSELFRGALVLGAALHVLN